MIDLEILKDKYNRRLIELETQLSEIKRKLEAINEVSGILLEEGISTKQGPLFDNHTIPIETSNKYADFNKTQAITDVLANYPGSTGPQVLFHLQQNGFRSESKSLKTDVYIKLNKLQKRGLVVGEKSGKLKGLIRYRLVASTPSITL
jgi:hypothetical protein